MGRVERDRARRILGVSNSATESELRAGYWALRAHVETRARGRSGDPAALRACESELRELEAALVELSSGAEVPRGAEPEREGHQPRPLWRRWSWLHLWAGSATLLALALGLALWLGQEPSVGSVLVGGTGEGEGGGGGAAVVLEGAEGSEEVGDSVVAAPEEVVVVSDRSELIAEANLEGATLRLQAGKDGAVAVEGPADSRSYWLEQGDYTLEVAHVDCPDVWRKEIRAEPGARFELAPVVCRTTGWLVVRANLEGASLWLDGAPAKGRLAARHTLEVGEHEVEIRKAGHRPWKGLVDIASAETEELWAELEPEPPPDEPVAQAPLPEPAARESARESADDPDREADRSRWHEQATRYLLSRYDRDRSGLLDSKEEIERIPCDEWLRLEAAFDEAGLGLPLTRIYGFTETGRWVENALGVSRDMRQLTALRMRECGLRR